MTGNKPPPPTSDVCAVVITYKPQIELLQQDYNTIGSFTAAALLTLMAILTLFLKSVVQWRLENQEKRLQQEGNHEH